MDFGRYHVVLIVERFTEKIVKVLTCSDPSPCCDLSRHRTVCMNRYGVSYQSAKRISQSIREENNITEKTFSDSCMAPVIRS